MNASKIILDKLLVSNYFSLTVTLNVACSLTVHSFNKVLTLYMQTMQIYSCIYFTLFVITVIICTLLHCCIYSGVIVVHCIILMILI